MRIAIFTTLLLSLAAHNVRASEQELGTIRGWGSLIDPDGDCSFLIQSDRVSIQVPGSAHGLSSEIDRMNAPRILQDISGDFAVEVKVDGKFLPGDPTFAGRAAYNGAGLLLWQDDDNYIRLERAVYIRAKKPYHYVNFEQRVGRRLVRFGIPTDFEIDDSKPCFLRLERKGQKVLGSVRQGDAPWHALAPKSARLPESLRIGIAAVNSSDTPFSPQYSGLNVQGDGQKTVKNSPAPKPDPYAVPDSNVEDLLAFIKKVEAIRPRTREEFGSHAARSPKALSAAADRILKNDDAPDAARRIAQRIIFKQDVKSISRLNEAKQRSLMDEVLAFCSEGEADDENSQLAYSLARGLEYAKRPEMAAEAYRSASDLMSKSDAEDVIKRSEKMAGAARRMTLLGTEMVVRGKSMAGKDFDLASYRGKVVLVDFWATWCGPCIAELPNVKKHYELYHDKGFEVVGVCLDTSRDKLEKFVKAREIPWVNLFEDHAGWDHPVANHYGVMGIPTVILINREGKAISLRARGAELGRLLEEEIGPIDPDRIRDVEEKIRKEMAAPPVRSTVKVIPTRPSAESQSGMELKKLGLAIHNHHSAFKQLPPRDNAGLSWRVHVLPFLGEQTLYREFKLDQPWDSDHNRKLIKRIPSAFSWASPELGRQGKTRIVFPFHADAIYRDPSQGAKFRDVLDGLSNTILAIVADEENAVTWTRPDDLPIDMAQPRKGWSEGVEDGLFVLMADGAVIRLSADISDDTVGPLLTRAGKDRVDSLGARGSAPRSATVNPDILRLRRAHQLNRNGEFESAIEEFRAAVKKMPIAGAHFGLAKALSGASRFDEARAEFRTALRILHNKVGDDILKKPVSLDGERFSIAGVYMRLAAVERDAGDPKAETEVWKTLVDAIEKRPASDDPVYWGVIGQGLYRIGRIEDSLEAMQKNIELRGEAEPTIKLGPRWWYLTMALARTGETETARKYYDVLSDQLAPDSTDAQRRFQAEAARALGLEDTP